MPWLNLAKEPEWDAHLPLPRRVAAGLQLFLHSCWWLARVQRVWALLLALALVQTLGSWASARVESLPYRSVAAADSQGGLAGTWERMRAIRQMGLARSPAAEWRGPYQLGTNLFRGTSRPLNARLSIVGRTALDLTTEWLGRPDEHGREPTPTSAPLSALPADLGYAVLTAGLLGLVLTSLRRGPLSGVFWSAVRRGLPLTLLWFLLLDGVHFIVYQATLHSPPGSHWPVVGDSLFALFAFAGALLPSLAVLHGSSLRTVDLSLRVLATHLWLVLGFLIPFRLTYDTIGASATYVTRLAEALWRYGLPIDGALASISMLLAQLVGSALALLVSIAFMLLALRSLPQPAPQPVVAEGEAV